MRKSFDFSSIHKLVLHVVLLTIFASCNSSEVDKQSRVDMNVEDWKTPCDLSQLCTLNEVVSSLNGPISFRRELKIEIDKNFNRFHKAYNENIYFICAQLLSVGGCKDVAIKELNSQSYELFMKGLVSCHHRLCHDFFQDKKELLISKSNKLNSKRTKKYTYLMAVKLPLPWYDKSDYLREYLSLIDEEQLKYEDIGPLVSAIPNHQGLKTFISKRFFKIDKHLDGIAIYLARYQNGWHDIYYKKFLTKGSSEQVMAFLRSMPVGCPRISTILAFKDYFLKKDLALSKIIEETLNQKDIDENFTELKLVSNKDSKCLSSSRPAF